ncbi:Ribosomal RNA large subunit methyltransferase L [Suttonella ornithocola]|uniref:Ribosomal RNA large subunit methyltransferase K/L n=1 Tax=Suttonella ornithocola TaxID=279832 RepID=A0A380MQ82_9GAMM|nr:bifunctional 23S rRNA (guanine(2069)-N(7))-methyltransferase RlmK/23S rRNA (guanine(2445)-N(2))-methyltransferase RlmL [Suttonella ornithocola]SUO94334.1 Ribosomal RNA large subunit methyltransferase L [Suttonella ornithocola]
MKKIILPCAKGTEQLLVEEAQALGLESVKMAPGVVKGEGSLETVYRLCLWSRLASRVLLVLTEGEIQSPEDLYQLVYALPWDDHLSVDTTFSVRFSGQGQGINNTQFGGLKVKDAIVDQLRVVFRRRPDVNTVAPDISIDVHLRKGLVTVALDLSGGALHQRGYRQVQGIAPIKESLAAAVLYRAKWHQLAKQVDSLIDPMCGSGTLLIEGLLMAADIAPGLYRCQFGFEKWQSHRPATWQRLYQEALERKIVGLEQLKIKFYGFDQHAPVLRAARENLGCLQIDYPIHFERSDITVFSAQPAYGQSGLIVCNPPYGERLGELPELLPTYAALGRAFKTFPPQWQMAIIGSNETLLKRLKLRSEHQYQIFNGALESRIMLYQRDNQPEAVLKSASEENTETLSSPLLSENAQMFANRLRKNLSKLDKWAKKVLTTAYRIYDKDLPEYAVAIDRYADWILVQEYAPPKDIPVAKAEQRLMDVIQALPSCLSVNPKKIVLKTRERQAGKKQYKRLQQSDEKIIVTEGAAKFWVNLKDYLDTGLFLDHRSMRRRIFEEAKDKKVLNLFCYTASVSVQAALGGASYTTSVDLSQTYLDWAWENFDLNELSSRHRLERGDVMEWLVGGKDTYDLIFCDPPTFSNTKKTQRVFDVQQAHPTLIERCMKRLAPGGVLYFSNNYRGFKWDNTLNQRYQIEEISATTIDLDFKRHANIHRVWKIQHK